MPSVAPALPLVRRGKVREMYAVDQERLLMVASDRVSAFDVVMDQPIPGKGAVLTALSAFWFRATGDVVRNHLLSDRAADLPPRVREVAESVRGRWLLVRRADRIDIECVVRGYLSGSAWAEYRRFGTVADEPLRAGLVESERLAEPIFTPAIKAESGHDENISRRRLAEMLGPARAALLEDLSLQLYAAGGKHAGERGLLLADTKFEFGLVEGEVVLIDEALTPDSSRYWPADQYSPGGPQPSFDKQFLRDFLERSGWNKAPPAAALARRRDRRHRGALRRGSTEAHLVSSDQPVWVAEIRVHLKSSVNDPQGLSIRGALRSLGFEGVEDVRAGKVIQVRLSAGTRADAENAVEAMCAQLLANPVIETYAFSLEAAPAPVP